MEKRYVRLDYEQALDTKREMLSSQINLLSIVNKIRSYKELRKKEISAKNQLKTELKALNLLINKLETDFPRGSTEIQIKTNHIKINKKEIRRYDDELEEIKDKLRRLEN